MLAGTLHIFSRDIDVVVIIVVFVAFAAVKLRKKLCLQFIVCPIRALSTQAKSRPLLFVGTSKTKIVFIIIMPVSQL